MLLILLVVLVIFAIGSGPYTGWHSYGYGPSGVLWLIVVVLIVLLLLGR